ncbi:hypothetical protein B0J14DRAFT_559122 [Halenospora varia]|nr:hypothetical protein B0J14DRAFT_559122 [Halenospora varia]
MSHGTLSLSPICPGAPKQSDLRGVRGDVVVQLRHSKLEGVSGHVLALMGAGRPTTPTSGRCSEELWASNAPPNCVFSLDRTGLRRQGFDLPQRMRHSQGTSATTRLAKKSDELPVGTGGRLGREFNGKRLQQKASNLWAPAQCIILHIQNLHSGPSQGTGRRIQTCPVSELSSGFSTFFEAQRHVLATQCRVNCQVNIPLSIRSAQVLSSHVILKGMNATVVRSAMGSAGRDYLRFRCRCRLLLFGPRRAFDSYDIFKPSFFNPDETTASRNSYQTSPPPIRPARG